jgi:hypothetical protein
MTVFIAMPAPPQKRPAGSFWKGPRKNFNGPGREPYMRITAADGKPLLDMQGWEMGELNDKDGDRQLNDDRRPEDPHRPTTGLTAQNRPALSEGIPPGHVMCLPTIPHG